jgi:hypothetical protein
MPRIRELARVWMILCSADAEVTSRRPLERAVANPDREFYHGDHRAAHFRKTGEVLTPASYEPPRFKVPTIEVSTNEGYAPSIEEIVTQMRSSDVGEAAARIPVTEGDQH